MKTKIELPVAALRKVMPGLVKVAPRRSPLPVYGCLRLQGLGSRVRLLVSDGDTYAGVIVPAWGEATGSVLLPLPMLARIVRDTSIESVITVEVLGDATVVRYSVMGASHSLPVSAPAPDDFPPEPEVAVSCVPLPQRFSDHLQQALGCASADPTRHILQGVCLDVSDSCHTLVATDGKHLYAANSITLPIATTVILPLHKVWTWKVLRDEGARWHLGVQAPTKSGTGWIRVEAGPWAISIRQMEGTYPNWRQVVPGGAAMASISFGPGAVTFLRVISHNLVVKGTPFFPEAPS